MPSAPAASDAKPHKALPSSAGVGTGTTDRSGVGSLSDPAAYLQGSLGLHQPRSQLGSSAADVAAAQWLRAALESNAASTGAAAAGIGVSGSGGSVTLSQTMSAPTKLAAGGGVGWDSKSSSMGPAAAVLSASAAPGSAAGTAAAPSSSAPPFTFDSLVSLLNGSSGGGSGGGAGDGGMSSNQPLHPLRQQLRNQV
jgi:hypothetical protein